MIRAILFGFSVALLLVASPELTAAETSNNDTFVIGAILPLTGNAAAIGGYAKNGILLAQQQLPDEVKKNVEIIFADDGWQTKQAVSAYHKLHTQDKVDAVIVFGSAIANAVAPLAERNKTILFAIGASDFNIVKERQFAFTHWVTPEAEASVLADEIKKRDYKRIAIVAAEQEGVIAVLNAVDTQLKKQALKSRVVLEQRFLPNDTDFRTFVAKARVEKVDAIIVLLFPGAVSSFAKQIKSAALDIDLVGVEMFEDENEVKASEGALIGHWYVNADDDTEVFGKTYFERYKTKSGLTASNGFDAVKLLSSAYSETDGSAEAISMHLSSVKDYHGASGVYSATGDNRFTLPAAVKVITKSGFEKLPRD